MSGRAVLLLLLLLVGGTACIHRPPRPPRAPERQPPPIADVITKLEAARGLESLTADLKIELTTSEKRTRLSGSLAVALGQGLRLELLSILGPPVGYGALSEEEASLFLPYSDKAFFHTGQPEVLLARLTGGLLSAEDLLRLLLGGAPPCRIEAPLEHRRRDDRFLARCEGSQGQPHYYLILEPGTLRLTGIEGSRRDGLPRFAMHFHDIRAVEGVELPFELELSAPSAKFGMRIRYLEIEANAPVDPGLFHLEPPEGAQLIPMEALLWPGTTAGR